VIGRGQVSISVATPRADASSTLGSAAPVALAGNDSQAAPKAE
jgi:hypothetical protein